MNEGFVITKEEDLDFIASNNQDVCARCGVAIDQHNDSGWEVFVSLMTTQPVCISCDEESSKEDYGKLEE